MEQILYYCKSKVIESIQNKISDYTSLTYGHKSYYNGQLDAFNMVIAFINHQMEKENG